MDPKTQQDADAAQLARFGYAQQLLRDEVGRRWQLVVLQKIAQRVLAILANRRFQRDRPARCLKHTLDAIKRLASAKAGVRRRVI